MDPRAELNRQLQRARTWLIAVGALMFAFDMMFYFGVLGPGVPESMRTRGIVISSGILAIFIGLWWMARTRTRLALILGLVVFWGLQLAVAVMNPASLLSGLILKIVFTVALVRGLQAASLVEHIRRTDLRDVFE
jgi:hypothetical protein